MYGGQQAAQGANVTISLTVGSTQSASKTKQTADQAGGSTLKAGGDVRLVASGGGDASNLLIRGSEISAGGDVLLAADHDVVLEAANNTADQTSTSKSSSGAIGVAATYGSDGGAVGVTISASQARGNADGHDVSHTNTHVNAAGTTTLISGHDTTLRGAQVAGDTVRALVGGNLAIESLQDTSTYTSKNKSIGGSATIGYGVSVSASYAAGNVSGDYASVTEQSGIQAGNGGFDVRVAGNTDLKGAVIASTQQAVDAGANTLVTGTLTHSAIDNHSQYDARSLSLSGGYSYGGGGSGSSGSQSTVNNGSSWGWQNFNSGSSGAAAGYASDSSHKTSTTDSGISGGTLRITDAEQQLALTGESAEQALAGLKRDVLTGGSADGLDKRWDGQALQQRMDARAQITATFGQQASKAIGDYASQQETRLRLQGNTAEADKWAEGGAYRVAVHTVMGALAGGVQGATGAAAAATAAPRLEQLTANLPAGMREVVGAAVATGLGAAAGSGTGAATAFNVDANNRQLHIDEINTIKQLAQQRYSEEQLMAVACAMVQCVLGRGLVEPGTLGNALTGDIQLTPAGAGLAAQYQRVLSGMAPETQAEIAQVLRGSGLFQYSRVDAFKDAFTDVQVAQRMGGVGQTVLGALGAWASSGLCATTGWGCAAVAESADNMAAGVATWYQGRPTLTLQNQAWQKAGLTPEQAATGLGIAAGSTVSAGMALNRTVDLEVAANAWARGTYEGSSAITFEGRVYRFSDPKYANSTWDIHPINIRDNHRYSEGAVNGLGGVGSICSGTAVETAAAEFISYRNWAVATKPKTLVAGDVRIDGVLDLTDPAALRALGVTKDQITKSSHEADGAYDQTQRIARWAREQGYNAILAPSAQTKNGTNLITFDSTRVSNVRTTHPIPIE